MNPPTRYPGAFRRLQMGLLPIVLIAAFSLPAGAATISISDDFETDAAIFDSWRSSPFVSVPPPVHLDGLLFYAPGASGRGLGFEEGFLVDAYAFLDYEVTPTGMTTTGGVVEFLLSAPAGPGTIELWGSDDGSTWTFLDEAVAGPVFVAFSLAIDAGDPAQYVSLRGYGNVLMDDLNIEVSYVPVPASMVLMIGALGALVRLRKRAA